MTTYTQMNAEQRAQALNQARSDYEELKALNLKLNMSRGRPCSEQLDLSTPLLTVLKTASDCFSEDGTDCRNYGVIDGIPEAKRLMAVLLDDTPEHVFVFGNASLTIMYDTIARCMMYGCLGDKPWNTYTEAIKFICPVPGYDRHFAILEQFGIEMVPVPLLENGPDMDEVERLVASDEHIKGIWCVPKYSNPTGIIYSDDVVRRLAAMPCAAHDFRIFWDNAYGVHWLYPSELEEGKLLDIAVACEQAGNPNRYYKFASTSKVTFAGSGIAAMAASSANIAETKHLCSTQMIGHDKLNQLRHARFLPSADSIFAHMDLQANILRPKFELVVQVLNDQLGSLGIASWTNPRGGYFISFDGLPGTAARTVSLAAEAGVSLTDAGATWPYGRDPQDCNIRIAPSMPSLEELSQALRVFVCCVKIAALETM